MALPIRSSDPMRRSSVTGSPSSTSGRTMSICRGVRASDTAMAMKSRTCTGTRGLENPGMIIRQAPIRLNTTNAAMTEDEAASFNTSFRRGFRARPCVPSS